jgi:hypothetical protein
MTEATNGPFASVPGAARVRGAPRTTLSHISAAVFLTDDEGRFTFIRPNLDVIFGYGHWRASERSSCRRSRERGREDLVEARRR